VNGHTHRHYDTDKTLFSRFTETAGITVNVIQAGDDELLARLEQEGPKSPCDVFITAYAGRLGVAKQRGLLQAAQSAILNANIPAPLRDPDGHWHGLTMRARMVAYDRKKVRPGAIITWADLAKPEWKGEILVRTSENVYNQSLLAAKAWADGIVANMARAPKGNDTDKLLALGEGLGTVAIVNSYYVGKLMASGEPEKQKAKAAIAVAFPTIGTHGTHGNVSGAGVARHAPHKPEALALLEYLSGDEAQHLFAEGNKEYPVKPGVRLAPELEAFGSFTPDSLNPEALARLNPDAIKVFDAAGWR